MFSVCTCGHWLVGGLASSVLNTCNDQILAGCAAVRLCTKCYSLKGCMTTKAAFKRGAWNSSELPEQGWNLCGSERSHTSTPYNVMPL